MADVNKTSKIQFIVQSYFLFFFIGGCISGPKDPEQSFAEQLSGESYNTSAGMGADRILVPVLQRKEVRRTISGKILCGEGISQYPANNVSIELNCKAQAKNNSSSLTDGSFNLIVPYELGDSCSLLFRGKCGNARLELPELISRDYPAQLVYLK